MEARKLCQFKKPTTTKMQKLFAIVATCLAVTLAYDVVQDMEGQEFFLVPLTRAKREVGWDVKAPGKLDLTYKDTVVKDYHKFDTSAYASKNFANRRDPIATGGRVEYTNLNTGSGLAVHAENQRHRGTDVGVEGIYNVLQKGPLRVDVTGDYSRHYGGPSGNSRPVFTPFVKAHVDF